MAPFKLGCPKEGRWAKQWLVKQITDGRIPGLQPNSALLLSGFDEIQSFVDRYVVEIDDRQRLQKALSARRAREEQKQQPKCSRKVTTELDYGARTILLKVAEQRGVTTSALIISTFESEFNSFE